MQTIGIVGAGAWGTALAQNAAANACRVQLWTRHREHAQALESTRRNERYLPGMALDPAIRVSADGAVLQSCDAVLMVAPAQHLRSIAGRLQADIGPSIPLVICAKGIEKGSRALMSDVLDSVLPGRPVAVLSGPSFAADVVRGLPTAVTLGCGDDAIARALSKALGRPAFRIYSSDDLVGVQIGGAVKNVIAIACGIVTGRALGDSARAALMTRGLAEISRFGAARGARGETLMGLSGLGDLTLTCNSELSRNMSLGIELGRGRSMADILAARASVAEGVATAAALVEEAEARAIDMPITAAVDAICNRDANIDKTIQALLARPMRAERE